MKLTKQTFAPLTFAERFGALPAHYESFSRENSGFYSDDAHKRPYFTDGTTVGEFLASIGAESSEFIDEDAPILDINIPSNTFCGGESIYGVLYAKDVAGYCEPCTAFFYVSRTDDSSLQVAVPA